MTPPSIKEIDTAADAFVDARNTFQRSQKKMEERKAILSELMKKHDLPEYEYDGKLVKFESKEKIRVVEVKEVDE